MYKVCPGILPAGSFEVEMAVCHTERTGNGLQGGGGCVFRAWLKARGVEEGWVCLGLGRCVCVCEREGGEI